MVYLTGPVYKQKIKDESGNVTGDRTLVGFRFTGQAQYEKSPFYRVRGHRYQIVNDAKVRDIEQNPLSYDPLTGTVDYTAETALMITDFRLFLVAEK